MPPKMRNFRKRREEEEDDQSKAASSEEEETRRLALEDVKFLQKLRERKIGISANGMGKSKPAKKAEAEGEKEDPNMVKYIEQELAKKRGSLEDAEEVENELKRMEKDLYKTPAHLKVKKHSCSTQWTGIAEVPLPVEYKLKNIEETEALLREKNLMGRPKSEFNIPSSDTHEKLRRDKKEFFEEKYGKGWAMMEKMGYDVLKGLGRDGQGIKDPIEALKIRPKNQGLGYSPLATHTPSSSPRASQTIHKYPQASQKESGGYRFEWGGCNEEDLKTEADRSFVKSEACEAKPERKKKVGGVALVPYDDSDEEDDHSQSEEEEE